MKKNIFIKKAIRGKKLTKDELAQVRDTIQRINRMTFEKHCEESNALFGKPYEEVHRWLDEFAGAPGIGMKHRRFRHHEEGIREITRLFGKDAGKVARQHIISDLKEEGWNENEHPFPKDEDHYIRMDLF